MLFPDILETKAQELEKEFDRLFQLAITSQHHAGDLILLQENGTYDSSIADFGNYNPHVIGPTRIGWSYYTHYQFINNYRQNSVAKITHTEWLEKIAELEQVQDWTARDEHIALESSTIHIESLIYLKIWESDYVIKTLYEFVRLLEGKPYDWYFKIEESARANNGPIPPTEKATGVRHKIIRTYIRERLRQISVPLYNAIKDAYLTQLRNSIAHSNFILQGRHMQLGNKVEDDPHSQLVAITFDEWTNKFHTTVLLYNGIIGILNRAKDYNHDLMQQQGNTSEVLVTDKREGKEQPYTLPIKYDPHFRRFAYQTATGA